MVVGALVARELGGNRRAQTLAAILVAFSPGMIATNWLFQPVAFDQLTTMVVLWLALRLALGRGSWLLLGVAAGIGLETKYTLAVVLVLLIATFLVWRRDVLLTWGFPLAVGDRRRPDRSESRLGGRARLDQRALLPEPAGERQRRDAAAVHHQPSAGRRRRRSRRDRRRDVAHPRPVAPPPRDGRWSAPSSRTSSSAASRTTRCPSSCSRSPPAPLPLNRWLTPRRVWIAGGAFVARRPPGPADPAARPAAANGGAARGRLGAQRLSGRRSAGPRTSARWSGTREAPT